MVLFQQIHNCRIGSCNMLIVSGPRMSGGNRLDKYSCRANHFICYRRVQLLSFEESFGHLSQPTSTQSTEPMQPGKPIDLNSSTTYLCPSLSCGKKVNSSLMLAMCPNHVMKNLRCTSLLKSVNSHTVKCLLLFCKNKESSQ